MSGRTRVQNRATSRNRPAADTPSPSDVQKQAEKDAKAAEKAADEIRSSVGGSTASEQKAALKETDRLNQEAIDAAQAQRDAALATGDAPPPSHPDHEPESLLHLPEGGARRLDAAQTNGNPNPEPGSADFRKAQAARDEAARESNEARRERAAQHEREQQENSVFLIPQSAMFHLPSEHTNETIPGGRYIRGDGALQNAHGQEIEADGTVKGSK